MILHLVTFKWVAGVAESDVLSLQTALTEMAADLPMITFYQCGPNLHLRPGGADFGVLSAARNADDLNEYLDHPTHQRILRERTDGMIASRESVQLYTDEMITR